MKKILIALLSLISGLQLTAKDSTTYQQVTPNVIMISPPKENLEFLGWPNGIINSIAFNTPDGIVYIDTQNGPKNMLMVKKRAEEVFETSKTAYVINTHGHSCHTGGNCIFTGTPIVAHLNCAEEISNFDWIFMGETLEFIRNKIADLNLQKDTIDENNEFLMDSLARKIELLSEYEKDYIVNYRIRYPDITFDGNFSIEPGNKIVNLIYMGKGHSESDLVVHIPSEKVLCTGNLFHFGSNKYTNFPTFYPRRRNDIESWIKGLDQILKLKKQVDYVIPTHVKAPMSFDIIEFTCQYISVMWEVVQKNSETSVAQLAKDDRFQSLFKKYSDVIKINSYAQTYHKGNIAIIQREVRLMEEDKKDEKKR